MKMQEVHYVAALAYIDERLDELMEDYGDLPDQVKEKEEKHNEKQSMVEETEGLLQDIKDFSSKAKRTLVELKDKEDKLTKQQFLVRNNKEFDAITKEIENIQEEHKKLSQQLRTEGVKQENLMKILGTQKKEAQAALDDLEDKKKELDIILNEQDDELKGLRDKREEIIKKLNPDSIAMYERIRKVHKDAAVKIQKNSCAGFTIPAQLINEARNNLDRLYYDENTGRILIPEELEEGDEILEEL